MASLPRISFSLKYERGYNYSWFCILIWFANHHVWKIKICATILIGKRAGNIMSNTFRYVVFLRNKKLTFLNPLNCRYLRVYIFVYVGIKIRRKIILRNFPRSFGFNKAGNAENDVYIEKEKIKQENKYRKVLFSRTALMEY